MIFSALAPLVASAAALFAPIQTPAPAPAPAPVSLCRFEGETRAWTTEALRSWDRLDARRLRIARPVTPAITLFDANCVYRLTPEGRGDFRVGRRRYRTSAEPHAGQVALPDGTTVKAERLAFASPTSDGNMFFIMALPSLWRADAVERRDPRLLAMVVFMHEFTHTQQADGLGSRIDGLLARGLPADATDDIVQERFGTRPGYEAAWGAERDAFYAAAGAPDAASAQAKLSEGLAMLEARQRRWFTGEEVLYDEADDVFLTLEGTGNWSAWAWLTDPRGGAMSSGEAVAFIRGGRSHWSQDEGLGLMLAIDRLSPDWPRRAFGPRAATAMEMAQKALR